MSSIFERWRSKPCPACFKPVLRDAQECPSCRIKFSMKRISTQHFTTYRWKNGEPELQSLDGSVRRKPVGKIRFVPPKKKSIWQRLFKPYLVLCPNCSFELDRKKPLLSASCPSCDIAIRKMRGGDELRFWYCPRCSKPLKLNVPSCDGCGTEIAMEKGRENRERQWERRTDGTLYSKFEPCPKCESKVEWNSRRCKVCGVEFERRQGFWVTGMPVPKPKPARVHFDF